MEEVVAEESSGLFGKTQANSGGLYGFTSSGLEQLRIGTAFGTGGGFGTTRGEEESPGHGRAKMILAEDVSANLHHVKFINLFPEIRTNIQVRIGRSYIYFF